MKFLPFKDMIALSKEKMDEAMAPIRAKQVQKEAELEMLKLESAIVTKQTTTQEMCLQKKLNFETIMDELDEIDLLERRKLQYVKMLSELFPEEAK